VYVAVNPVKTPMAVSETMVMYMLFDVETKILVDGN
jgi:hypothetical protein